MNIFKKQLLWFIFIIGGFLILFTPSVLAQQTPDELAKKYNITFPIVELGSCNNYGECREFCEDPVNRITCEAYARSKGFYKPDALSERQEQILAAAKSELGCTDKASCESACQQQVNFDKCSTFAQKYGIRGGHTQDPAKQEVITRAREVLGCQSYQECQGFCHREENREKCDELAKQIGLRGGEVRRGPAGCTSPETCKAYCSDPNNFNECARGRERGQFSGPGGCNSEESCRKYCTEHPAECRNFSSSMPQPIGVLEKPEEYRSFCEKNPERCRAGGMEEYCRTNPEKCSYSGAQGCPEKQYRNNEGKCVPFENYTEAQRCFQSGRMWIRGECRESYPSDYPHPTWTMNKDTWREQCLKGPSCRWENDSCRCENYPQPSYAPPKPSGYIPPARPSYYPYPTGQTPEQGCRQTPGCTWQGTWCQCSGHPGGDTFNPQEMCLKSSSCRWENNACKCDSYMPPPTSPQTAPSNPPPPPGESMSPEQMCLRSSYCKWENNSCSCTPPPGSYSDNPPPPPNYNPGEECSKTPGCYFEGNTCKCNSVQGVSTTHSPNILQSVLDWFQSLFK